MFTNLPCYQPCYHVATQISLKWIVPVILSPRTLFLYRLIALKSLFQVNGDEFCEPGDGYNIAVIDYTTGESVSSGAAVTFSGLNDFLTNITNDSVVVVVAQNITER